MFKQILFAVFCLLISAAPGWAADIHFPELSGRVVDEANIISPSVAQQINSQLSAYEQSTTNQIVVVTVPDLNNIPIEEYGYQLGRHWGIGQKGKNNGALLIVAPKEHKVRMEVGYGLEGDLTDAASSVIINRILTPAFKRGDFSGGIQQGVTAMIDTIGGKGDVTKVRKNKSDNNGLYFYILVFVFLLFLRWLRSGKSGVAMPFLLGTMLGGGSNNDSDDDSDSFSGGGGSFGGGGSSGSW